MKSLQQTLQQNRALHRSTTEAPRPAADVELYSSTLLYSAPGRSASLQLYSALHSTSSTPSLRGKVFVVVAVDSVVFRWRQKLGREVEEVGKDILPGFLILPRARHKKWANQYITHRVDRLWARLPCGCADAIRCSTNLQTRPRAQPGGRLMAHATRSNARLASRKCDCPRS